MSKKTKSRPSVSVGGNAELFPRTDKPNASVASNTKNAPEQERNVLASAATPNYNARLGTNGLLNQRSSKIIRRRHRR